MPQPTLEIEDLLEREGRACIADPGIFRGLQVALSVAHLDEQNEHLRAEEQDLATLDLEFGRRRIVGPDRNLKAGDVRPREPP